MKALDNASLRSVQLKLHKNFEGPSTHFVPLNSFYSLCLNHNTKGFLTFLGGVGRNQ